MFVKWTADLSSSCSLPLNLFFSLFLMDVQINKQIQPCFFVNENQFAFPLAPNKTLQWPFTYNVKMNFLVQSCVALRGPYPPLGAIPLAHKMPAIPVPFWPTRIFAHTIQNVWKALTTEVQDWILFTFRFCLHMQSILLRLDLFNWLINRLFICLGSVFFHSYSLVSCVASMALVSFFF